jgi:hypothetical protein
MKFFVALLMLVTVDSFAKVLSWRITASAMAAGSFR